MSDDFSFTPSSSEQPQSNDDQLKRFKSDLKEVVPIDLYDASYKASMLKTDIIQGDIHHKASRHAREFYQLFHLLFRTLKKYLPKEMAKEISEWIASPDLENPDSQAKGIDLFYLMYDEMVAQGIGELFETPIRPMFDSILGDIDLDKSPDSLLLTDELGEEYINPGDIGNLTGGVFSV